MAAKILLQVTRIRYETPDAKTLFLKTTDGTAIVYEAGQFITFLFQRHQKEVRRSYSISSSPDVDDELSITVKREVNGDISRFLVDEVGAGQILEALYPSGIFTIAYQTHSARDIFLVAGGSGIAPIYSLLKSVLIKEPQSKITLLYSNHDESRTIFYHQLRQLQHAHPSQLEIEFLFSNHRSVLKARLSATSLEMLLNRHLHFTRETALVYTCGPFGLMQTTQIVALSQGFNKDNIRKEIFTGDAATISSNLFFDHTDREISLTYMGKLFHLLIAYNQTILHVALKNGIDLPYSCKAGKCSACKVRLVKGKVWMHYNEVLTGKDEANGWVLTCTGHPVTEDVELNADSSQETTPGL